MYSAAWAAVTSNVANKNAATRFIGRSSNDLLQVFSTRTRFDVGELSGEPADVDLHVPCAGIGLTRILWRQLRPCPSESWRPRPPGLAQEQWFSPGSSSAPHVAPRCRPKRDASSAVL